jgi:hypothetical protein
VDIDPRCGGAADPQWRPTLTATTPTGGTHLYYACEQPIRNSQGLVAPGIDIRGAGGMVATPPSRRAEGVYAWVDPEQPIAKLPAVIMAACLAGRDADGRKAWNGVRFEPRDDPATPKLDGGAIHEYLTRYAGWAGTQGVVADRLVESYDELVAAVLLHADEVCALPTDEAARVAHVERICGWIAHKEWGSK